jgi:Mg2+ and Co2+ transporter CorA
MSESRFFRITPSGGFEHFSALHAALSSLGQGGYIWLDYTDPTKEDLSALVGPLKIHPWSIEDCLD